MASSHPIKNTNDARTDMNLRLDVIPPLFGPLAKFDVVHPFMPWKNDDLKPETGDESDKVLDDYYPVDFSSLAELPPPVSLVPSIPSNSIESVTSLWLSPPSSPYTARDGPTFGEVDGDANTDHFFPPDLNESFLEPPPLTSLHLTLPVPDDLTPTPTPAPTRSSSPRTLRGPSRSKGRSYFDICTWNSSFPDDTNAVCRVQRRASSLSPPSSPAGCPIFGVVDSGGRASRYGSRCPRFALGARDDDDMFSSEELN